MKRLSENLRATRDLAEEWLKNHLFLAPNKQKQATVVFLSGDLGSGKTTFTQHLAKSLGVKRTVPSPTFVIRRDYDLKVNPGGYKKLIHIDFYRLKGPEELKTIGWEEILKEPENLILVEWPERVGEDRLGSNFHLHFRTLDENSREIIFSA